MWQQIFTKTTTIGRWVPQISLKSLQPFCISVAYMFLFSVAASLDSGTVHVLRWTNKNAKIRGFEMFYNGLSLS